jgi:hypothetical protein
MPGSVPANHAALQQRCWQLMGSPPLECQVHFIGYMRRAEPTRSDQEREVNEVLHAAVGRTPGHRHGVFRLAMQVPARAVNRTWIRDYGVVESVL